MNATITDGRLPGGTATGKVIGYVLRASGDGSRLCEVTIGCTIGNGTSQTAVPGTPTYAADGYMEPGYQLRAGETRRSRSRTGRWPRSRPMSMRSTPSSAGSSPATGA